MPSSRLISVGLLPSATCALTAAGSIEGMRPLKKKLGDTAYLIFLYSYFDRSPSNCDPAIPVYRLV